MTPQTPYITETRWFTTLLIALLIASVCGPALLIKAELNLAALLSVAIVFVSWTVIGRRFYPNGFYQFFDFLSFMSFIAGAIVVCIVVYRWVV